MTTVTLAEVQKHTSANDCWVIIRGNAYNVTEFLPDHPGGKKAILMVAGKDATEEFEMLHKASILSKYAGEFLVGPVQN